MQHPDPSEAMEAMEKCVSCHQAVRGGKLLRCFHALCAECVDEHTRGNGTRLCPRCTKETESLPSAQLPSLPSNVTGALCDDLDGELRTNGKMKENAKIGF